MNSSPSLTPINEIDNLGLVAYDLNQLMSSPENEDIKLDFPVTAALYSRGLATAMNALSHEAGLFEYGRREVYIVNLGHRVAGLCVVSCISNTPPVISKETPNFSEFICQPYRGNGLGRFSLEQCIKIFGERFEGKAWTEVRDNNEASKHLVKSVGFCPIQVNNASTVYKYTG